MTRIIQDEPFIAGFMAEPVGASYSLVLQKGADPATLGGVAVCGLTTVGSVGVIAASHLIKSMNLNPMGTVDAIEFLLDKLRQTKSNDDFFDSMNA